tara:strand:- start:6720 stop:7880 length:1161 start_codon:yes stop_codon:yes gene_type:complete
MGKLRKIGKKIKKGMSGLGKKLKKGFGKIAKAFGKLGPLGSIALSFLLPGLGNVLAGWLGNMGTVGKFILDIGSKIQKGANWVKDGVGRVFNRVTDAIEAGMNRVSGGLGGTGQTGSNFRNWVSEKSSGFIDKSTVGLEDKIIPESSRTFTFKDGTTRTVTTPSSTISPDMQVGNIKGPKIPQTPKGMTDPVYMDGVEGGLKKGFYESADIDTYYKGIDTSVGNYNIKAPTGEPMKGFTNVQPIDITAGPSTDVTGFNISGGPSKPIRAVDNVNIKTTGDLKAPKPKGDSYFGESKAYYKKIAPITAVGTGMIANEQAEEDAIMQAAMYKNQRANMLANESMGMVTPTYAPESQQFINIMNLDNDNQAMHQMQAGYGLILGDFYNT